MSVHAPKKAPHPPQPSRRALLAERSSSLSSRLSPVTLLDVHIDASELAIATATSTGRPSPSQQSTRQAPSPPPSAPTLRLARGSQFARPQPFTTSQPTRDLSGAATLQLHHDIRLLGSNV